MPKGTLSCYTFRLEFALSFLLAAAYGSLLLALRGAMVWRLFRPRALCAVSGHNSILLVGSMRPFRGKMVRNGEDSCGGS